MHKNVERSVFQFLPVEHCSGEVTTRFDLGYCSLCNHKARSVPKCIFHIFQGTTLLRGLTVTLLLRGPAERSACWETICPEALEWQFRTCSSGQSECCCAASKGQRNTLLQANSHKIGPPLGDNLWGWPVIYKVEVEDMTMCRCWHTYRDSWWIGRQVLFNSTAGLCCWVLCETDGHGLLC